MMDLVAGKRYLNVNNTFWGLALQLASQYGWEPAGTSRRGEWDGNYFTNGGQILKKKDALGLANALEKALPDIPDHDAITHKCIWNEQLQMHLLPCTVPVTPFEMFSGKNKTWVKKFIAFCKDGGFRIY